MEDRVREAIKSIVNTAAWDIICEEFIQKEIIDLYSLDNIKADDTALNLKASIKGNKLAASRILDLVARMNTLKDSNKKDIRIECE